MLAVSCHSRPTDAPQPRIISYSPSVTDILFDLGLGDHVVGVTSWCILPAGQTRPIVGAEKNPNPESILSLRPDLIFIQEDPAPFESLRKLDEHVRVVSVQHDSVEGILQSIRTIALEAGVPERGEKLAGELSARMEALRRRYADQPRPRVLFVTGYDHPATGGKGTYLDEVITLAGGANVAAELYSGWKNMNAEAVLSLKPDVLICQVFDERQAQDARRYWENLGGLPAAAAGKVIVSTDRRLTFYGSRVADVAERFADWIHGQAGGASAGGGK